VTIFECVTVDLENEMKWLAYMYTEYIISRCNTGIRFDDHSENLMLTSSK